MTSKPQTPKSGDVVTASFTLQPNGDFIPTPLFDDGQVTFILDKGNYLPSIHEIIHTLEISSSSDDEEEAATSEEITVDAGYGERREELIAEVPLSSSGLSKDDLEVGLELYLANGMKCRITEIKGETFVIDANPPLAGASYTTRVTLDKIEKGPSLKKYMYCEDIGEDNEDDESSPYEVMTIALGCFWGGELEYMRVPGVVGTAVGYTQGDKEDPTYKEVCSGTTGHTEAIQVIYNPNIVSYEKLVTIGMERLGDSRTLLNQVGNDRGTQYRHGVYYHNEEQRDVATKVIASYGELCVTECKEASIFYNAEDYHQQYLLKGGQSAKKNAKETIRCYG